MRVSISSASKSDVHPIVQFRNAVAAQLTKAFGKGHWSSCVTERAVERNLRESEVFVARAEKGVVATLRLASRKPWAIDAAYFTGVPKAVYLHSLAVSPRCQRRGIGKALVAHATAIAREMKGDAIRLDAYDAPAGAGPFYVSCGFREVGRITYRGVPLIYFEQLL